MIEPYFNLAGKAGEALEFYKSVFDGETGGLIRLGDMPGDPAYPIPPEMKNLVAHGWINARGTKLHFSDMQDAGGLSDKSKVSLMLPFSSEDELTETYHKLLDGGMALMELSPQSFASLFAWVKDKFGIDWQLMYD